MIYTYAATALVAIVLGFGGGWQIRDWKAGADRAAELDLQAREQARDAIRVDVAATGYDTQRAAGQQRTRVVIKEVERVIQADPVYRDRCLTDDGLRLVSAALAGADPASIPTPALPAASAPR